MSVNDPFTGSSRAMPRSQNAPLINDEFLLRLNEAPETLTDAQLRETPLRILAKGLTGVSPDSVVDVYLRWLEVQRQSPKGNLNFNWSNTITHWTQSLRARGFSLNDINVKLGEWRKANGPFTDPKTSEEARFPPLWEDLSFGWSQVAQGAAGAQLQAAAMSYESQPGFNSMHSKSFEVKMESPLTSVPPSYICNRCKGRGHLVTDCPTNEDPAYDLPPGIDYICKFCGEAGAHYYMFCPQHPGKHSIYKQRQVKQAQADTMNYGKGLKRSASPSWGSSRDMASMTQFPFVMKGNDPARSYTTPKKRLEPPTVPWSMQSARPPNMLSGDAFTIDRLQISSADDARSKTPEYKLGTRHSPDNRIKGSLKDKWSLEPFTTPSHMPFEADLGRLKVEPSECDNISAKSSSATDNRMAWERLYHDNQRINAKERRNLKRAYQFTTPASVSTPAAPDPPELPPDTEFLQKLFANHPSQTYNQNRRIRPTALEMWDIVDKKKLRDEAAVDEGEMADISDNGASSEELDEETRDKAIEELFDQVKSEYMDTDNAMDMDVSSNPARSESTMKPEDIKQPLKRRKYVIPRSEGDDSPVTLAMDRLSTSSDPKGISQKDKMKNRMKEKHRREDLQKQIDTIETLKMRLDAGEEMESDQLEKIANGDVTQEELDQISAEMPQSNSQTSSRSTPSSSSSASPLSSPPRYFRK